MPNDKINETPEVTVPEVVKTEETAETSKSPEPVVVTETPAERPITPSESESAQSPLLRQQLKDLTKQRNEAETPEEESFIKARMKEIRKGLSEQSKTTVQAKDEVKPTDTLTEEEEETNVRNNLKKLGYLSKDEVIAETERVMSEKLAKIESDNIAAEHDKVINDFYKSRADIYADKALKQDLETYVFNTYRIEPNTPAANIAMWLKDAADKFVPLPTNRQDNARSSQDKIDLLNISGTPAIPKVTKASSEERGFLKQKGWSDEKIDSFYS